MAASELADQGVGVGGEPYELTLAALELQERHGPLGRHDDPGIRRVNLLLEARRRWRSYAGVCAVGFPAIGD